MRIAQTPDGGPRDVPKPSFLFYWCRSQAVPYRELDFNNLRELHDPYGDQTRALAKIFTSAFGGPEIIMIKSNRSYLFGMGMISTIPYTQGDFLISTASEGFFKGYATVISLKMATGQHHAIAKAILNPSLSKDVRWEVHSLIAAHFDSLLPSTVNVIESVREVLSAAKATTSVVDFVTA